VVPVDVDSTHELAIPLSNAIEESSNALDAIATWPLISDFGSLDESGSFRGPTDGYCEDVDSEEHRSALLTNIPDDSGDWRKMRIPSSFLARIEQQIEIVLAVDCDSQLVYVIS